MEFNLVIKPYKLFKGGRALFIQFGKFWVFARYNYHIPHHLDSSKERVEYGFSAGRSGYFGKFHGWAKEIEVNAT